ncbi:MAG: peroxidase-related enzyme [Rubrivivax sp.]|nr:peroxidase-related enzyme [Rubrivivax sp.]
MADPDRPDPDVIDRAAGLAPGDPLHALRRYRATVVDATQKSHDALLHEPVPGLPTADRLRVAAACCEAAGATALAAHYRALLDAEGPTSPAPALHAALQWAATLTTDPRRGDRAALQALKAAGYGDAAIVALAQLVAFLSYQLRGVAVLQALKALHAERAARGEAAKPAARAEANAAPAQRPSGPFASTGPTAPIRIHGFTNETLDWRSWLEPVVIEQATPLQLEVLDESHAQARTSAYYRTLVHQPLMLRHRSTAYNAIMYAQGGAPRAERELAAMVVSVTNGCVYCTSVHAQRYAQLARRTDTVEQVFTDPATAGTNDRERAVATAARALTQRPGDFRAADLAPLSAAGLADEEIIDVMQAAAIFGWANRLMHNLGEPVYPAEKTA